MTQQMTAGEEPDGLVRGLLCHRCNAAIGLFSDSPELLDVAIEYLRR